MRKINIAGILTLVVFASTAYADVQTFTDNASTAPTIFNAAFGADVGLSNDIFVPQFNPATGTLNSVTVTWFSSYQLHYQVAPGSWTLTNLQFAAATQVFGAGPTNTPPYGTPADGIPGEVDGFRYPHLYFGPFAPGTSPDVLDEVRPSVTFPSTINGVAGYSEDMTFSESDLTPRVDGVGGLDYPDVNGSYGTAGSRNSFTLTNPSFFSEYLGGGSVFFDANLNAFRQDSGSTGTRDETGSFWIGNFRIEVSYDFTPVPEPSTYAMLGLLSVIGGAFAWRTRQVGNKQPV